MMLDIVNVTKSCVCDNLAFNTTVVEHEFEDESHRSCCRHVLAHFEVAILLDRDSIITIDEPESVSLDFQHWELEGSGVAGDGVDNLRAVHVFDGGVIRVVRLCDAIIADVPDVNVVGRELGGCVSRDCCTHWREPYDAGKSTLAERNIVLVVLVILFLYHKPLLRAFVTGHTWCVIEALIL